MKVNWKPKTVLLASMRAKKMLQILEPFGLLSNSALTCHRHSSAFVSMHSAHVPVAHEETVAQVHRADDNDDFCVSDVVEQFVVTGDSEHNYA